MNTEETLVNETEKWLKRIKEIKIVEKGDKGKEYNKNIKAYISDTEHFLEKKDFVRAFEAVIWAWAWMEIAENEGFVKLERDK